MSLERRGMARSEWRRILRREYVFAPMSAQGWHGYAGLMRIHEVSEPFVRKITLADAGYAWLQLAPMEQNWWLTVMYDASGRILQYYFDITARNFVADSGEPMFEDLYLDIVMQANGDLTLMDADELDEALRARKITREQHALALETARVLLQALEGREQEWRRLCEQEKRRLEKLMDGAQG